MKPGDDQHAVEEAIGEQAEIAGCDDPAAELVDPTFEIRIAKPERHGAHQPGGACCDRHEPSSAEEGEIVGQLDVAEAVVEHARGEAREDSGRDAELVQLLRLPGRDGEIARGLIGESGGRVRRHLKQRLRPFGEDEKADGPSKARSAVVLARQPDGDADSEQEPQMGEDRVTGRGDERDVEQVRLAEPEQQAGNRQHRDRKHQRAAERLELVYAKLDHRMSP
jgi:hypothetical protein